MTQSVARSRRGRGRMSPADAGSRRATATTRAVVIFGDVVGSRRLPGGAATWLSRLVEQLDAEYDTELLAPFGITQGDEIQGLLAPPADPFAAFLRASLADEAPRMRWAVVAGVIDDGDGPATRRTGPAFLVARDAINEARRARDGLVAVTGDARADELLDGIAPVLAESLDRLTERQRTVARLMLLEGRTQAEVAESLRVSRATVSVSYQRAGLRSISRLLGAVRHVFAEGAQVAQPPGTVVP